jgi:hypothetical protein
VTGVQTCALPILLLVVTLCSIVRGCRCSGAVLYYSIIGCVTVQHCAWLPVFWSCVASALVVEYIHLQDCTVSQFRMLYNLSLFIDSFVDSIHSLRFNESG